MRLIEQPTGMRLGDWLNANLVGDWSEFRAAVAFVKRSGVKHIAARLAAFAQSRAVEVVAGLDHQGTSFEGLRGLLDAMSPNGRVVVFHNPLPPHVPSEGLPFKSADRAEMVVGSGNLTEGGLYTNYEVGAQVSLDLGEKADREVLESIEGALDDWGNEKSGTSAELEDTRLESLLQVGLVLKEAEMAGAATGKGGTGSAGPLAGSGDDTFQFDAVTVPGAPERAAFGGGYGSRENLKDAKALGVKHAVFHKKRGVKVEDMTPSAWMYRQLKRFRAGVEAGISYLKRCFGLGLCRWRGLPRFKAYVLSAVFAQNLVRLAGLRPAPT